jgi:2'-5' RNA ligase
VDDEAEELLTTLEADLTRDVTTALGEVAAEFTRALARAQEVTAASFSVSRIAAMWARRLPRILRRLVGIAESGARTAATALDATLPDDWEDLPARHDDGDPLPEGLGQWAASTEHLLTAVGERLAEAARADLAAGLDAGEDTDALRARLRAAFDHDATGSQLGATRAERIARTEAGRAWNAATLAAGRALTGPGRPLVKQWLTRRDGRVRDAHAAVNGQIRLLEEPFTVAGQAMDAPGDPTAPPDLSVNCRCLLALAHADERNTPSNPRSSFKIQVPSGARFKNPRKEAFVVEETDTVTAADGGPYTSGMVALVPTAEDAARLAVEGGLPAQDLHLTLVFLGDADAIPQQARTDAAARLTTLAGQLRDTGRPLQGRAFAVSAFNPGEETAIVLGVGGDDLPAIHAQVTDTIAELLDLPPQHTPWAPHVTLTYDTDLALIAQYADRTGPIRFDRLRLALAGDIIDIPLVPDRQEPTADTGTAPAAANRSWSTPGDAALAYENTETGDGRIFAPGALSWTGGPWPLQYADEMLSGHDGAELAGAIEEMSRDTDRITGRGVLYISRPAGAMAAGLLDDGAPLGVSVDLDDVDIQFIDRTAPDGDTGAVAASAHVSRMSLLPLAGGGYAVRATHAWDPQVSAAAHNGAPITSRTSRTVEWTTGPGGTTMLMLLNQHRLPLHLNARRDIIAAAGDRDDPTRGELVHTESTGDVLMRITRARVRGATLVAMPAYDQARIVLDPASSETAVRQDDLGLAAAAAGGGGGGGGGDVMRRVIAYTSSSPVPVTAAQVATALGIPPAQARDHLVRATRSGHLIRLAPGLYVAAATLPEQGELSAAASGQLDLPVADRDTQWDGDAAASRVLARATSEDGEVDAAQLAQAFLYRDPDADPATLAAYKLGHADVIGGDLVTVPAAVFAIAGALQGARGGVDIPDADREELLDRVETLYGVLAEALDDPTLHTPWDEEEDTEMRELEASAWQALKALPPMPAAWFAEPTEQELPMDAGGVHLDDGRIFGWVARAGEPHAGYPGRKLTIESLGNIDLTHFLRSRRELDDGATVRVGALTMNAPHSRDGAECETAACQFDDTRTVAGLITVGLNERGMWFAGAAAPWLSEWDRAVFAACQPSYHMLQQRTGRWQLRAVLSVPVPGHSTPLAASVVHRSNVALAASAAAAPPPGPVEPPATTTPGVAEPPATATAADIVRMLRTDPQLMAALAAEVRAQEDARRAEVEQLNALLAPVREELAASAAPTSKGA